MAYVLLGILVLGLLASIYIAVMSSKTWPIYQTVLVVFVFIAAMVFFYLGARTLKTHQAWRESYNRNLAQAEQLESQILPLAGGVDPQGVSVGGDIPRLKHELSMAVRSRGGGVFYNVKATGLADGVLSVTLAPPGSLPPVEKPAGVPAEPGEEGVVEDPAAAEAAPAEAAPAEGAPPAGAPAEGAAAAPAFAHGLVPNSIVFAFEQKPVSAGGHYLGEFKVTEGAGDNPNIKLAANLPLTEAQTKRLEAAAAETLVLFTTMPPDDAKLFASMEPAQRAALLPAEVAEQYASADRPLRDYLMFFHEDYVQRGLIGDSISQTTSNIQRTEAAAAEAAREAAFRETEKTNLAAELTGFQRESQAIAAYRKSLEDLLSQTRNQLKATYVENRNAAATLTRAQLEAAEEINRRTNLAAQ